MDRDGLTQDLKQLLAERQGQDKYQLVAGLRSLGWTGLTITYVNSVLYQLRDTFQKDDSTPSRWRVHSVRDGALPAASRTVLSPCSLGHYRGPPLRAWQEEALEAWRMAGRRGVVEAVASTGKTVVGVMAAADAVARGGRVLILVPGLDLLQQWYPTLLRQLPGVRIGRLGGGHDDSLIDYEVLVATVQSACRNQVLPAGQEGLLIADEVHHYGAEVYSGALRKEYAERLGLTATYERSDDGIARHLRPYFTPASPPGNRDPEIVAGCDYERGLADGILARLRVALVGVDFHRLEMANYQEFDETARKARADLINRYGCPAKPYGEFVREVNALSEGALGDSKATWCARRYLNAFTKRRALLADCFRKLEAVEALGPLFASTNRALVFTETVDSAKRAAARVRRSGVAAEDYTSELDRNRREKRLHDFRRGKLRVLAAPRVLDEGIDVPEADLGVILAASHTRRQMVQRMGRIIRPSADGRPATFVVLYVRGTSEDPDLGAHEAFPDQITGVAESVDKLENFNSDVIEAWFNQPACSCLPIAPPSCLSASGPVACPATKTPSRLCLEANSGLQGASSTTHHASHSPANRIERRPPQNGVDRTHAQSLEQQVAAVIRRSGRWMPTRDIQRVIMSTYGRKVSPKEIDQVVSALKELVNSPGRSRKRSG